MVNNWVHPPPPAPEPSRPLMFAEATGGIARSNAQPSCVGTAQIIVDRTLPFTSSPTAELMIEKAILHMARQPAVIAIDSLHRFLEFHPSATLNRRVPVSLREALCKPQAP